jgi:hypothetical protein
MLEPVEAIFQTGDFCFDKVFQVGQARVDAVKPLVHIVESVIYIAESLIYVAEPLT